jgi:hypothetical protein
MNLSYASAATAKDTLGKIALPMNRKSSLEIEAPGRG